MPDLLTVFARRWRLMLLLTLAGTGLAYIASLLSPKLYMGTTTALPVNTLVNDKARIFSQNIEGLYSEIGTADELDKVEGTAQLDTVYLAVADKHHLAVHYGLDTAAGDAVEKAALMLRRSANVNKTGYGEFNVKVWDKDNTKAAALANALLQTINDIHSRLQTENSKAILEKLKEAYTQKRQSQKEVDEQVIQFHSNNGMITDSIVQKPTTDLGDVMLEQDIKLEEAKQYAKLIGEYELVIKTAPKVLLVVEQARPSPWYDRPKTSRNVLLAFLASLLFSFLLALFIESRNARS